MSASKKTDLDGYHDSYFALKQMLANFETLTEKLEPFLNECQLNQIVSDLGCSKVHLKNIDDYVSGQLRERLEQAEKTSDQILRLGFKLASTEDPQKLNNPEKLH